MVTVAELPVTVATAAGGGAGAPAGHAAPTPITFGAETESSEATKVSPAERIEQIKALKEEFAKELELSEKALKNATTNDREAPVLQLAVDLLQRTDLVYGQQLAALERKIELDRSRTELEESLTVLRASGPSEERPYSFLLLDSLRDELTTETAKSENVTEAISSAKDNLEHDKDNFEEKEQIRRQAKEELDTNQDKEKTAELDSALRSAKLHSKFAEQKVILRQLELENQTTASELNELRMTFLQEKIKLVAPEARFVQSDLQNQLDEIAEKENGLNNKLEVAKQALGWRERKLLEARQRLDETISEAPALVEEVETWRLARESKQAEVSLLTKELVRLSEMKQLWNNRYRFANGDYKRKDIALWTEGRKSALEQLARDERLQNTRLADLRKDLLTVDNEIEASDKLEPDVLQWVQGQRNHLRQLIGAFQGDLANIETRRRLEEKFLAELSATTGTVSIAEWAATAWEKAKQVWAIEITHVDDRPITVGKIFLSILFFLLSIAAARFISAVLGRRILPGVGLSHSASMAFQSVVFYFLLLGFTLVILNLMNVPLTAFTVLGGAIAIGVGFGAQNIINNFISGWILIAGQNVRVDDLIEVEHQHGHVKSIGARSTLIRRDDGIDMLVPNSHLLEHTVVNWTLTDHVIRTKVSVGVRYGSPAEKVKTLIRTVVDEDSDILKDPAPLIIFHDFGANALIFEVYFWISAHSEMDVWKHQSNVRFRIDELFREAGVIIAFPQQDVHLDAVGPIDVRMVSSMRDDQATLSGRVGPVLLHE